MEQPWDHVRFSVIVPAYNEAAYLGRALDALQHQDYDGKYEIIVVDNNSTDATVAVAARCGVRVVSEPRQGVCAARQRGVDCAQGEIIVSTDADTTQPSDWLRTIDAGFAASDNVVADPASSSPKMTRITGPIAPPNVVQPKTPRPAAARGR